MNDLVGRFVGHICRRNS